MGRDDHGNDIGPTFGDLTHDIGTSLTTLILSRGRIRRLDGDGFSIYWMGSDNVRIDVKLKELGVV